MCRIRDLLKNPDHVKEICKAAFDEIDTDKLGRAEQSYLPRLLMNVSTQAQIDPPTETEVLMMMEKIDPNMDGQITFDTFSGLIFEILNSIASKEL